MGQCVEKVSQERLKELLHYESSAGLFFWKESRGRIKKGELAGCISERKSDGYKRILIGIDGVSYKAHQLAWLWMMGYFPYFEIDHEDRNPLNNRWSNIRRGDEGVNARNRKKVSRNTSGYNGVSWCKREGKWRAYCTVKGRMKSLGYYPTAEEAYQVSKSYREAHNFSEGHGE